MEFDDLSKRVIGCAIEVHRELGPGLLESTCEQCLVRELSLNGISFQLRHPQPVDYNGIQLDGECRIDVLIKDELIVALKPVAIILCLSFSFSETVQLFTAKVSGRIQFSQVIMA